jgi:hypothetical protein
MTMLLTLSILLTGPATDISGTWQMGLELEHVIPVALVLAQEGTSVTGTVTMPPHGNGQRQEVKLSGELIDGTLKLSGVLDEDHPDQTVALTGRLQDDGSLAGTVSARGHDMKWTAERLRGPQ